MTYISPWTDERKEDVRALWPTHSGGEIADVLSKKYSFHFTRNMVVGIIHRMGLSSDDKKEPHPNHNDSYGLRKKRAESNYPKVRKPRLIVVANGGGGYRLQETVQGELPLLTCGPIESRQLTIHELTDDTCRWPGGEPTTFCGHIPVEGKPYCAAHCLLAYKVPEPVKLRVHKTMPQSVAGGFLQRNFGGHAA